MRYAKEIVAVAFGMMGMQFAVAAPTAEEAAQLGNTLTPYGAIKAGNAEGTIPEWTGGLCQPPAGYAPANGLEKGGAPYVDPFADDKPLVKITAANMAEHEDKLDAGTAELLRRFPDTFYVLVYPTRRSACFPEWVYENTIKRVMSPRIESADKTPSVSGAHAQIPFPIPKTGIEAVWNAMLSFKMHEMFSGYMNWYVDSSGRGSLIDDKIVYTKTPYWDNSVTETPDDQPFIIKLAKAVYPPSSVGTLNLNHSFLRMDLRGDPVWSYIPGQRRVRRAPEFAYDGVVPNAGGVFLYDESSGFSGRMDRFDFELLGRKEIYIPYNVNTDKMVANPAEVNTPSHLNPEHVRWELHRVWVVEGTLKAGERHVQQKKVLYIDEDSWKVSTYYGIDQGGNIHHLHYYFLRQMYDVPTLDFCNFVTMDLSKRAYAHWSFLGDWGDEKHCSLKHQNIPPNWLTSVGMTGIGVR